MDMFARSISVEFYCDESTDVSENEWLLTVRLLCANTHTHCEKPKIVKMF